MCVARRTAKRALVLGCNGQDGSYLVEHLLRRGYDVTGISRQRRFRYAMPGRSFRYVSLDLRQPRRLARALTNIAPDVIFHMAAVHGEAGSKYERNWQDMLAVNVGAAHICLEYLRNERAGARLVYAGSCKIFGPVYPRVVNERSPSRASCLYTVTKIAAHDLIACYRRDHGLKVAVLHLFNHESVRRGPGFLFPTLISALDNAIKNPHYRSELNTLQFYGDWGSAQEYMDIAVDIAEKAPEQDVIIATGRTWKASDLVQKLFKRHGLDYRRHLIERGLEVAPNRDFRVSTAKLKRLIGRVPREDALVLSKRMLSALTRAPVEGSRASMRKMG